MGRDSSPFPFMKIKSFTIRSENHVYSRTDDPWNRYSFSGYGPSVDATVACIEAKHGLSLDCLRDILSDDINYLGTNYGYTLILDGETNDAP